MHQNIQLIRACAYLLPLAGCWLFRRSTSMEIPQLCFGEFFFTFSNTTIVFASSTYWDISIRQTYLIVGIMIIVPAVFYLFKLLFKTTMLNKKNI